MAMSCRCPCEKLAPPVETLVSKETEDFASISAMVDDESMVSSWPLRMEEGREAEREDATLCSRDVLREAGSLSDTIWTLTSTS